MPQGGRREQTFELLKPPHIDAVLTHTQLKNRPQPALGGQHYHDPGGWVTWAMFWDLFWSCSCDILRKGEFTKLTCDVSEQLETQVPLDLANSSVADLSDHMAVWACQDRQLWVETLRLFGASLEAGLGPDDYGVVGSSTWQWCGSGVQKTLWKWSLETVPSFEWPSASTYLLLGPHTLYQVQCSPLYRGQGIVLPTRNGRGA